MLDPFVNGRGKGRTRAAAAAHRLCARPAGKPAARHRARLRRYSQGAAEDQFRSALERLGRGLRRQQHHQRRSGRRQSRQHGGADYGFAAGMDYHVSPPLCCGFALAGGGTMGLANGLGGGYSEALQFGAYGISWFGRAYLAGALVLQQSLVHHQPLRAWRSAHARISSVRATAPASKAAIASPSPSLGAGGLGVTPYGAVQSRTSIRRATVKAIHRRRLRALLQRHERDRRTHRTRRPFRRSDFPLRRPLILFGRLAWAHDFVSNPALSAAFEALPGSTFTVNGAPIPQNSALTTAGAQFFLASNWSVIAKFDGEFASGSQTYGGSGTLRYSW